MAEMANNPQYPGVPQPPRVVSNDPTFAGQPMPFPFRPGVPALQSQQFIQVPPQQFQPVGLMPTGLPSQAQQPQFPPLMQQFSARPGAPALNPLPPPSQPVPVPNVQPFMQITPAAAVPQANIQAPSNYPPGLGGTGAPPVSYRFAPPSYGQPQVSINANSQYQSMSQMHIPSVPASGQSSLSVSQSSSSIIPQQHQREEPAATTSTVPVASIQPKPTEGAPVDWIEHTSADGRKYYYNKRTKQSTWDKPFALMTPIERADASTDWKEFLSLDGRKYFYNKVTKQSKWTLPEELKLAREQVEKAFTKGIKSEASADSRASVAVHSPISKETPGVDTSSSTFQKVTRSPVAVGPVSAGSVRPATFSESLASPVASSLLETNVNSVQTSADTDTPLAAVSETAGIAVPVNTVSEPLNDSVIIPAEGSVSSVDEVPKQDNNETQKDVEIGEKSSDALEEKTVEKEHVSYANKLDAKNTFRDLLESANVGSDWTWDQAMRIIINDKRYGALRTLSERKQAFNEFLGQKKKQEADERRNKLKKAREDFKKMLEETVELTSSTRWSKAITVFKNDERFTALEREKERRDLFDNYLAELKQKEKAKAQEERKRNLIEYRQFLESCDFIKANSQFRKVQDLLEVDDRCSRLDKIDRLEIFQEYIRDLEKEEEEQRKIEKEELRKAERKNRDEFRKLMERHVSEGTLTAKTQWRDYHLKVKDLPAYLAVASNTSGSTPKELYEDVAEELEKQYQEDKVKAKDTVKFKKIPLSSTTKLEDFKESISKDTDLAISDINLKLIFDELLERAREKEEKEAKKRKRLADDFLDLLHSSKEISASSTWENCRQILEGTREFSAIDESVSRGIFDEYLAQLKEKAKANDRKRKEEKAKKEKEREDRERKKARHGRDKEREREKEKENRLKKDGAEYEHVDVMDADYGNEHRRSVKDNDKKHRKRHKSSHDDLNEDGKDRSKSSRRHSDHRKKSRRHASTPESESESKHKRHKKDHRNGSRKSGDSDELEDGEFGEEPESR